MNLENLNSIESIDRQTDVLNEFKKFNTNNHLEDSKIEKLIEYVFEHDPNFLESVFNSTKDLREVIEKLVQLDNQNSEIEEEKKIWPFHGKNMMRAKVYSSEANLAHHELLLDKYTDMELGKTKEGANLFQKLIMFKARFDGKIAKIKESSKFDDLNLEALEKIDLK